MSPPMSQMPWQRLSRFSLTGLAATGLHTLVALTLIEQASAAPPLANGIAFCFATGLSYLMNTLWSFNAQLHKTTLFRYIAVSFLGLGLSISLAWFAEAWGWPPLGGIALVVCVVPAVSFVLHHQWTYR